MLAMEIQSGKALIGYCGRYVLAFREIPEPVAEYCRCRSGFSAPVIG
jgi:hypothetical protein